MTQLGSLARRSVGRVAPACTYYTSKWRDRWAGFTIERGFEVMAARTMFDQSLYPVHEETKQSHWHPSAEQIASSIEMRIRECTDVDAIVVTGAGARTLSCFKTLQSVADRPVIGADTALYRALAAAAGIQVLPKSLPV